MNYAESLMLSADLGDEQGAVVFGRMAAGEAVDGLDDGLDDPRRVEVATAEDGVEPIDSELDVAVVHGLGDAVGVEGQGVVGLEREGGLVVFEIVDEAQGRTADLVERVDERLAAPFQPRWVVPGAGVVERATATGRRRRRTR